MLQAGINILERVPLAPLTTLGVGGPARFFVSSRTIAEVELAVAFARERQLDLFVLGGGSNLVVSDRGFNGLVLQIGIDGIEERPQPRVAAASISGEGQQILPQPEQLPIAQRFERWESSRNDSRALETTENAPVPGDGMVTLDVGAGIEWDKFVALCVSKNYGGVECLSGIPGTVGGSPVQNVGAYGQEVSDTIVSVLTYDLHERRVRELQKQDCGFSYRTSVFNSTQRGRYIILLITYALRKEAAATLRYADLQRHFASNGNQTLSDIRDAVLKIRARKGMVINPSDPDSRSVGSFFKNPVLSTQQFAKLEQKASVRGLNLPRYPALSQHSKTSAAWLVENSGFHKGYAKGTVGISTKHALAIVNRGGATAADIVALRDEIQSKVEQIWGVRLDPEPVFVGF